MRKYFIGAREVTKTEWSEAYKRLKDCSVIIRTDKLPEVFEPPKVEKVISPERAKQIREKSLLN